MIHRLALLVLSLVLTACAATSEPDPNPTDVTASMLDGQWLLTMPAGHEREVAIHAIGDDEVLLVAGESHNLSGRYRLRGNRLSIIDPADNRMARLTWHLSSDRKLILIDAPSAASVGSNYTGATLTRQ